MHVLKETYVQEHVKNKHVLWKLLTFLLVYMHQMWNWRARADCKWALIKVLCLSGPFGFLQCLVEPLWLFCSSLTIVMSGSRALSDSSFVNRLKWNTTCFDFRIYYIKAFIFLQFFPLLCLGIYHQLDSMMIKSMGAQKGGWLDKMGTLVQPRMNHLFCFHWYGISGRHK